MCAVMGFPLFPSFCKLTFGQADPVTPDLWKTEGRQRDERMGERTGKMEKILPLTSVPTPPSHTHDPRSQTVSVGFTESLSGSRLTALTDGLEATPVSQPSLSSYMGPISWRPTTVK